jgi:hypothetical protein
MSCCRWRGQQHGWVWDQVLLLLLLPLLALLLVLLLVLVLLLLLVLVVVLGWQGRVRLVTATQLQQLVRGEWVEEVQECLGKMGLRKGGRNGSVEVRKAVKAGLGWAGGQGKGKGVILWLRLGLSR